MATQQIDRILNFIHKEQQSKRLSAWATGTDINHETYCTLEYRSMTDGYDAANILQNMGALIISQEGNRVANTAVITLFLPTGHFVRREPAACDACGGSGDFNGETCWHCGGEGADPTK